MTKMALPGLVLISTKEKSWNRGKMVESFPKWPLKTLSIFSTMQKYQHFGCPERQSVTYRFIRFNLTRLDFEKKDTMVLWYEGYLQRRTGTWGDNRSEVLENYKFGNYWKKLKIYNLWTSKKKLHSTRKMDSNPSPRSPYFISPPCRSWNKEEFCGQKP